MATSAPSSWASIAALRPAPPPPMTRTSCSYIIVSPEFQVVLDCFAFQFLDVLGERDVLRTHLGTGELGLTAPDAVFLLDDVQPVLLHVLALALVHREPVGLVDGCRAEVLVVARCDVTGRHTRTA